MAVKQIYKADDNSDHPSEEAAERWNLLLSAQQDFNQAAKLISYRLAETATTADGELFQWGVVRNYWYLDPGYWQRLPRLHRVDFYHYSCRVEVDQSEQQVVIYSHAGYDACEKFQKFKVCELYAHEKNAKAAHLKACQERLKELTEEVAKMREEA